MPKKAHTEEQIVAVLRQAEAGEKVADICRKVGITPLGWWGPGGSNDWVVEGMFDCRVRRAK